MTPTSRRVIFTSLLVMYSCESKIQVEEKRAKDPISNILENIIVVDVTKYLPAGYILSKEVSDEDRSLDQSKETGVEVSESSKKAESSDKFKKKLDISGSSIFNAIYNGESLSSVVDKENKGVTNVESSSFTSMLKETTRTTTTTTTTSTTTWGGPPPGTCYRGQPVCSLAGSVLVVSGLSWEEELAYPGTVVFLREAESLARELGRVIQLGYFGTDLKFIDIEGFLNRSEGVLVDFYLEFRGFNHDVSTDDIGEAFKESMEPGDEGVKIFGNYGIDTSSTYFVVADPLVPNKQVAENKTSPSPKIPDWAWLVISGGTISTIIIVMFGTINGYMRYKKTSVMRTMHSTTLDGLKDLMDTTRNISEVNLGREEGVSYRQGRDKRDIWTLQRIKEQEGKRLKTFHHPPSSYIPTTGSCGGDSACSSLQEDTVVRNKDQKDVTDMFKTGIKRSSLKNRGQSTNVSNLNLLEESFESVSGDSDDQIVNNLVLI